MKQLLVLSALMVSLAACSQAPTQPVATYPYNPDANATEQNDARIPYRGDWAFVALLADGTSRAGVAGILTRYSGTGVVNAGGGVAAWCTTVGCTTSDEQGTVLFGTVSTDAGATLSIGMVPKNQTFVRFAMTDTDGVVSIVDNQPTISGTGIWRDATGTDQDAKFAFVQIHTESTLTLQSVATSPYRLAGRLAAAAAAHTGTPTLKTTFERALAR